MMASLAPRAVSRRTALAAAGSLGVLSDLLPAAAVDGIPLVRETVEQTAKLPTDTERFPINLALRPDYGIEVPDVRYPEWFMGSWNVTSSVKSVFAPAGVEVFAPGRNGTDALRRARQEPSLTYKVRWRRSRDGRSSDEENLVVDRKYNTASISRASMGTSAVQNIEEDGPDHLTLVLTPAGAPSSSVFSVDLTVVSRRVDPYPLDSGRPNIFACAETTRQTVTSIPGGKAAPSAQPKAPVIKEIETIVTYELDATNPNIMRGYQRTATFLVPDAAYTGNPTVAELAALRLARAPDGRYVAVDVRVYDLVYTRIV